MKKTILFIAINIFYGWSCLSQIIVKDFITQKSIPFVEIYSGSGLFIGMSDENGNIGEHIRYAENNNITNVILYHSEYTQKNVGIPHIQNLTELHLQKRIIVLDTVSVFGTKKGYIKLTGYYRIYQLNNDTLKYYTDGIVAYFISNKNGSILEKVLSHRSIRNKILVEKDEKFNKGRNIILTDHPSGTPFIESQNIIQRIKKMTLEKSDDENNYYLLLKKQRRGRLFIDKKNNITSMQFSKYTPEYPRELNLFGYHSVTENNYEIEYYNTTKPASTIKINNLIYQKQINKYKYKHKKQPDYERVESVYELFVLSSEWVDLTDTEKKEYKRYYSFSENSNYKAPYWIDVKNKLWQPLPKSIEDRLNKTDDILQEYPQKQH